MILDDANEVEVRGGSEYFVPHSYIDWWRYTNIQFIPMLTFNKNCGQEKCIFAIIYVLFLYILYVYIDIIFLFDSSKYLVSKWIKS